MGGRRKANSAKRHASSPNSTNSRNNSVVSESDMDINVSPQQLAEIVSKAVTSALTEFLPVMKDFITKLVDDRLKTIEWPPINATPLPYSRSPPEQMNLDRREGIERWDKQHHLVILNVPEPSKVATGAGDKNANDPDNNDDLDVINQVSEEMGYTKEWISRAFRMGKKPGKRPLKVHLHPPPNTLNGLKRELLTYSGKQEIAKAYKSKLSAASGEIRLRARHDLTDMQRGHLRHAHSVLAQLQTLHPEQIFSIRFEFSFSLPMIFQHVTDNNRTKLIFHGNPEDKVFLEAMKFVPYVPK